MHHQYRKIMFKFFIFCFAYAVADPNGAVAFTGRIIGGEEADILQYPYQASVQYLNSHRCGAAIIARTWILTGAHCFEGLSPLLEYYSVRVGTTYREVGGQVLNVSRIISHANYSNIDFDFDIALVHLRTPITLSRSARIIGLPDNVGVDIEGSVGNLTGWGSTYDGGSGSSVLRVVQIPVLSHAVCRDLYYPYTVSDRMFCAGLWDGGKDACSGDGGGPLAINWVVYGLVSWGIGCGQPQRPGVYTDVATLRDWITEHTGI